MDDNTLDNVLRARLAPLRQLDNSPSQLQGIMNALETPAPTPQPDRGSHDWLLLTAWCLAALVALPLLLQMDASALASALDSPRLLAPTTLLSLAGAALAGLLVYPLLTE